jgi:large subunit ribosomal protein L9
MKVVLTQDVRGVGKKSEIKEVSDGYARNNLLPRRLAVPATEAQVHKIVAERGVEALRASKAETAARELANTVAGVTLHFKVRVGEQNRIFGSITSQDIAEAVSKQVNVTIDKRKVDLDEPIRHVGTFTVPIRMAKDLVPTVNVVVEPQE